MEHTIYVFRTPDMGVDEYMNALTATFGVVPYSAETLEKFNGDSAGQKAICKGCAAAADIEAILHQVAETATSTSDSPCLRMSIILKEVAQNAARINTDMALIKAPHLRKPRSQRGVLTLDEINELIAQLEEKKAALNGQDISESISH